MHACSTTRVHDAPEEKAMPSLRELRAERLLSIRELAERADVAPRTVYLIEAGRSRPRPRVARRISAALRVLPVEVDEFRLAIEAAKTRPARADYEQQPRAGHDEE